jgi:hypothetical protein
MAEGSFVLQSKAENVSGRGVRRRSSSYTLSSKIELKWLWEEEPGQRWTFCVGLTGLCLSVSLSVVSTGLPVKTQEVIPLFILSKPSRGVICGVE